MDILSVSLFPVNFFTLSFFFAALVDILLIIYLFYRKITGPSVFWFILLLLGCCLYSFAQGMVSISVNAQTFIFWESLNELFAILNAPLTLFFAITYVGKSYIIKKLPFIFSFTAVTYFLIFLLWKTTMIVDNDFSASFVTPWGRVAKFGVGNRILDGFWAITVFISLAFLFRFYFQYKDQNRKKQTRILITGFVFLTIGSTVIQGIIPDITHTPIFPGSIYLEVIFDCVVTYLLLKYGEHGLNIDSVTESLLKLIPSAVIIMDKKKTIKLVNDAALKLFQYSLNDFLGIPISKLFPQDTEYSMFENKVLAPLTYTKTTQLQDIKLKTSSNITVPVTIDAAIVKDIQNNTDDILLAITNIQFIKEKELQLEQDLKQIQQKTEDVERINRLMVNRELAMVTLKKQVEDLQEKLVEMEQQKKQSG